MHEVYFNNYLEYEGIRQHLVKQFYFLKEEMLTEGFRYEEELGVLGIAWGGMIVIDDIILLVNLSSRERRVEFIIGVNDYSKRTEFCLLKKSRPIIDVINSLSGNKVNCSLSTDPELLVEDISLISKHLRECLKVVSMEEIKAAIEDDDFQRIKGS
ncbi:hypothetical protein [Pleionea sp. CnH1-48]|uniref:hypothetical protein n=1 Tax=Pleionea sp. CnH1-48 TaxID=2954494 RepID=UPI002097AD7A|nr:hypothetical protein [Pleionea sp. CnH1-48]MCO7222968.1 hypothetical protein [Pleionea sp. CnH1-48]